MPILLVPVVARVAFVLLAGCAFITDGASGGPVSDFAQDLADAMCPFPLRGGYSCPIPMSSSPSLRSQEMKRELMQHPTAAEGMCSGMASEGEKNALNDCVAQWNFYAPGTIPVGTGYDVTVDESRLPWVVPIVKETSNVHTSKLSTATFKTIMEFMNAVQAGSPEKKNFTAGTVPKNMNQVYNSFFTSSSGLHVTIQTDVVRNATLADASTEFMLPYLRWMIETQLTENSDDPVYAEFISQFGTHVVTKAAIGGALTMMQAVSSCFLAGDAAMLSTLSKMQMGEQSRQVPTSYKFNSAYTEHVGHNVTYMYGGDPTFAERWQWPQREKTIIEAPVLIHIDEMVPVAQYVGAVKPSLETVMQDAVDNYIANQNSQLQQDAQTILDGTIFEVVTTVQLRCEACRLVFEMFGYASVFNPIPPVWDFYLPPYPPQYSVGPGGGGPPFTGTLPIQTEATMQIPYTQYYTPTNFSSLYSKQAWMCSGGRDTISYPLSPNDNVEWSGALPFGYTTVQCSLTKDGKVYTAGINTYLDNWEYMDGPAPVFVQGPPTIGGCSIGTKTYHSGRRWLNLSWTDPSLPLYNETLEGTITYEGWCCLEAGKLAVSFTDGGCVGTVSTTSCPNFGDSSTASSDSTTTASGSSSDETNAKRKGGRVKPPRNLRRRFDD